MVILFSVLYGNSMGMEGDAETLLYMKNKLPENAHWAAFGIGRHQLPTAVQSMLLGGHIRVGLEDNLYLERGVLATNAQLVDKITRIIEPLGAAPMSPEEARQHLNLIKQ